MNMREYIKAVATTDRSDGRMVHRTRIVAGNGQWFHLRLSPKYQLARQDTDYSRGFPPDWLPRYDGMRYWEEPLAQWLIENDGFGVTQAAIEEYLSPISEVMSSVVQYGHVRVLRKNVNSALDRVFSISCVDGKSGHVVDSGGNPVLNFSTLRELRGWLQTEVSVATASTRPTEGRTLAEWLGGKVETGVFAIDMRNQEVPQRHRSSELELVDNWLYVSDGEPIKQRVTRAYPDVNNRQQDRISYALREALRHRIGYDEVLMDVTHNFRWSRGTFGDPNSCYWTSEVNSRNMLTDAQAFAIRFWAGDEDEYRGVGRCWAIQQGNAIAIFNAYGRFQLHEIAAILEHATGHKCVRLSFSYANIYVNNERAYGWNYINPNSAVFYMELNTSAPTIYRRLMYCNRCNDVLNPSGAEEIPDSHYCAECEAIREEENNRYRAEEERRQAEWRAERERLAARVQPTHRETLDAALGTNILNEATQEAFANFGQAVERAADGMVTARDMTQVRLREWPTLRVVAPRQFEQELNDYIEEGYQVGELILGREGRPERWYRIGDPIEVCTVGGEAIYRIGGAGGVEIHLPVPEPRPYIVADEVDEEL